MVLTAKGVGTAVNRFATIGTAAALALVASGCFHGASGGPGQTVKPVVRGGTLRVVMPLFEPGSAVATSRPVPYALDPQVPQFHDTVEVLRCCLARTLLGYAGLPTEQGGATLRPDLATRLPDVSADGRTWTFHLRRGIHYGPPLADVEITSRDFVRAFERRARLDDRAFFAAVLNPTYPLIEGYTAFARGRTDRITGVETPDRHTLVIRLTRPAGDLAARLALPDASPIPPAPSRPRARYGVATGHDQTYGRFLVSTGPYMIEGSDRLDFRQPAARQQPASGFRLGRSLTLVRNPSWRASSDPLRPAYVDRIEIRIGGTTAQAAAALRRGAADIVLYAGRPPQFPPADVERYRASARLGRVEIHFRDFVRYVSMNLAVPPFDDIHVRRAMNYVVDKEAAIRAQGGAVVGQPARHIALDSLLENALVSYDPYRASGKAERVALARQEMARSRYDRDHDGRCDAPACRGIRALALSGFVPIAKTIRRDLRTIGLSLRVEIPEDPIQVFQLLSDPKAHVPLALNVGYGKDDLNGAGMFPPNFSRSAIGTGGSNYPLLGATAAQLRRWGYRVKKVPSVDARIAECQALAGGPQTQCWASLDQYLMEQVVPWVPVLFESHVSLIPPRIVRYSFDQLATLPALDRIALRR